MPQNFHFNLVRSDLIGNRYTEWLMTILSLGEFCIKESTYVPTI